MNATKSRANNCLCAMMGVVIHYARFSPPIRSTRSSKFPVVTPTKLDQTRSSSTNCLIGVVGRYSTICATPHDHSQLIHDFSQTTVPICTISSTSTRPIPDDFPIALIYSIATRLFGHVQKYRVGSRSR